MSQTEIGIKTPTNVERLEIYLQTNGIRFSRIEQMAGATANYVFRVFSEDGVSSIYKHAGPYFASSIDTIPYSVERMDFEATAMSTIPQVMPTTAIVRIPKVINYDQGPKVLVMSDGGRTTLTETYNRPNVNVPEIGRLLGEWLAVLHGVTLDTEIGEGGYVTANESIDSTAGHTNISHKWQGNIN
ncbi:MAG: hypothetical protein Q9225_004789 [Loekoesia sp. 1 TL-2023]